MTRTNTRIKAATSLRKLAPVVDRIITLLVVVRDILNPQQPAVGNRAERRHRSRHGY